MYKPFVIPSSVWVWLLGAKYESSTPRTVIMRPHRKETGHTHSVQMARLQFKMLRRIFCSDNRSDLFRNTLNLKCQHRLCLVTSCNLVVSSCMLVTLASFILLFIAFRGLTHSNEDEGFIRSVVVINPKKTRNLPLC